MITLLYSVAGVIGITASMSLLQLLGGTKSIFAYKITYFITCGISVLGLFLTWWLFVELKKNDTKPKYVEPEEALQIENQIELEENQ